MSLPEIVTRERWLEARTALLAREKELTRAKDALAAERRRLPMVEVTKDYRFTGADGEASLADLFEGRDQLIVQHFMFDPAWEEGCPSCTAAADETSAGLVQHLAARRTTLTRVARAPIDRVERYKARRGWTFSFWSSYGTDFNADFGVTVDASDPAATFNYAPLVFDGDGPMELPGLSCFLRAGDRVFHTYSTYARGGEQLGGSYGFLDMTALGRQEPWEEPKGRAEALNPGVPVF